MRYKNNKFSNEVEFGQNISKVVYHHIIYMCDFFCEFRRLFFHGLHGFSRML